MTTFENITLNGRVYNWHNVDELYLISEPDDSWRNTIYHFLLNWYDTTDYITVQTSGSTGKPKPIRLPKESMMNSARMTNQFFGLSEVNTCLLCLPASYIAGKMMLVRTIMGGFNLLTVEPSSNPFQELHTPVDFTAITPFQLFHSAEILQQKSVRKIIVGGGPVSATLEKLCENIPSELYETYGMTETCSHIALRRFNGKEKTDDFTALDGVKLRLDNRNCLAIYAPHLLKEEIQTNDLVELKGVNSFHWIGRADSTINSGGIKIHPEQIEKKLEGIIPTSFFISSIPDESLENKVVLIVESEIYSSEDEKALKALLVNVLDKYELPRLIIYNSPFVYSDGHKVLRKQTLEKALKRL